ncbi:MAG: hypothetical protein FWB86_03290 [Treponema sp.]|nr:hypothetical protein [Treponema sp.]MCL2251181.1 hypothetical protein [Treponema sp.]
MKALIITDGTESIQSIALLIKESLTDYQTDICTAEKFQGNEVLPANIFFIGCSEPSPSSFEFLEMMLSHINFASRKCGVFALNKKTGKYLLDMLKDSEAQTAEPLLITDITQIKKAEIKKWLKLIIK